MKKTLEPKHTKSDFKEQENQDILELHRAFTAFKEERPWDTLIYPNVIQIQHPDGTESVAAVLGRDGIQTGINVFVGENPFLDLVRVMELDPRNEEDTVDMAMKIECLVALTADREDMDDVELKAMKRAGIKYRGRGNWPQMRRHTAGFMPWRMDRNEAQHLTVALRTATEVAQAVRDGRLDTRPWHGMRNMLTVNASKRPENEEHSNYSWTPMPPYPTEPFIMVESTENLPAATGPGMVLSLRYSGYCTMEEGEIRPRRPGWLIIGDETTGMIVNTTCLMGPLYGLKAQMVAANLLNSMEQLPRSITVLEANLARDLRPLADALGIQMNHNPRHPIREAAEAVASMR